MSPYKRKAMKRLIVATILNGLWFQHVASFTWGQGTGIVFKLLYVVSLSLIAFVAYSFWILIAGKPDEPITQER